MFPIDKDFDEKATLPKEMLEGNRAFITGSYAYGTPNEKSDVDLVVLIDIDTVTVLDKVADSGIDCLQAYQECDIGCLYFGKLNLIFVCDTRLFEVWRKATEFLKTKAPVTREVAIAYMDKRRRKWMADPDGKF